MHITAVQLMTLIAVAELGSMVAAARQLGYSPSTVSAHINAVERHVGRPVVARTADGSRLTSAGRQAVLVARMIVSLYEYLDDATTSSERESRPPGSVVRQLRNEAAPRSSDTPA